MMKKISIMMTSFNLEDYIDASIQSVIQQDMPCDWELLIGDDGSTDGTVDLIHEWVKKYPNNIKLYQIPRDAYTIKTGARAAKNRAYLLEQANGDYLHFLDGDDCWTGTDKLRRQYELLESPKYSNCSCCAHNTEAYVISENIRYLLTDKSINKKVFGFKEYWKKYYFHTNTILFRSECKEKLLDSIYRDYLNDNFITFLLIQYGDVLYLPDVWCVYNMTGEGLWTGGKQIYGLFRNMQIVDLQLKERPSARKTILYRHRYVVSSIRKTYKPEDYSVISPLLDGLDNSIFHYTYLLSKTRGLSREEIRNKKHLYQEVNNMVFLSRVSRAPVKLCKIINLKWA